MTHNGNPHFRASGSTRNMVHAPRIAGPTTRTYPPRPMPRPVGMPPIPRSILARSKPSYIDVLSAQLANAFSTVSPPRPAPRIVPAVRPRRGDKVRLTLSAYVGRVNADGTFELSSERGAFVDPITLDRVHGSYLVVTQTAEREPRVGDVITGDVVRLTPWKRGTILRGMTAGYSDRLYVLRGDGRWQLVDDAARTWEFDEVLDVERYRVEYAPGKAHA